MAHPTGLPEHGLYLVVDGTGRGVVARRRVRLRPGTAVWISPRASTTLRAATDQPVRLLRLRLSGGPSSWHDDVEVVDDAGSLTGVFEELVDEFEAALPARDQRLDALLVLLFSGLFRLADRHRAHAPLAVDERSRVEQYVDQRPAERPTVADLAAQAGLSEDYFARRFRRTVGEAPKTWLVRRRVHAAALRLDGTDEPVSAVAAAFGYPDVYLFSRQFRAVMGRSPRAWRNR